jgi:putative RNA 2'-phosphotransferase
MDKQRLVKVSKYLSKHLRHQPQRLGLELQPGGWVDVDELLQVLARNAFHVSRSELEEVVRQNDKQRFTLDAATNRIRANQGHSVKIDLQLEPSEPPTLLYHGTGEQTIPALLSAGIRKMGRHHVHLTPNFETAVSVGRRHGVPVVLSVDSATMHRDGLVFYRSDNGVWLVDEVPPRYLKVTTSSLS